MKTLALFSSKGGVGRTSIAYHLGFMFAELGRRVLLADLDPQANLSEMCLPEHRLDAIWTHRSPCTIAGAIDRLRRGAGDIEPAELESVTDKIALVPGDLQLSDFEDDLAQQWAACLAPNERAFRVTTALYRVVMDAGTRSGADLAIVDLAPNFGAINRAALIAADYVIVPVVPDPMSLRGLENVGRRVAASRREWADRLASAPRLDFELPAGKMTPLGYVVARHQTYMGRPLTTAQHWIERMPVVFRQSFELPEQAGLDGTSDVYRLAQLRDYRSLMPMALEAKHPMFLLKPADGAIGAFQRAVHEAYAEYRALAETVLGRISG